VSRSARSIQASSTGRQIRPWSVFAKWAAGQSRTRLSGVLGLRSTDAVGNHSSADFHATVGYVSSVAWSAVWGEPVGTGVDAFVANAGRTLPIKVQVVANGVERTTGRVDLSVASCGGGAVWSGPLAWDGSRWTGHLDTSWLNGPGCYRVSVALDGIVAGSFRLDLRGSAPAAPSKASTTKLKA
jgi:hypothetical protein